MQPDMLFIITLYFMRVLVPLRGRLYEVKLSRLESTG